ncbi:MAG: hypothetical protein RR505_12160 [Raoultibacter sp.]
MLKLYKKGESITFPNGVTLTYEDMCVSQRYAMFANFDFVIDVDSDGVVSIYERLAQIKDRYEITEEDPDTALSLILAAQAAEEIAAAQERTSTDEIQTQLNALTGMEG